MNISTLTPTHDSARGKVCKKCNQWRPLSEFGRHPSCPTGRGGCRQCAAEYTRRWTIAHKEGRKLEHVKPALQDPRKCVKCLAVKPLTDFYREGHRYRLDCKDCNRASTRKRRLENPMTRERERARRKTPERIAWQAAYAKSHPWRGGAEYHRRYRKNYPDKGRAHNAVYRAKLSGKLRPQPCNECGSTKRTQAHHRDYSKPLDVVWLCAKCHWAEHNSERRAA